MREDKDTKYLSTDPNAFVLEEGPAPWLYALGNVFANLRCHGATVAILGIVAALWICGITAETPMLFYGATLLIAVTGLAADWIQRKKSNEEPRALASAPTANDESHA